MQNNLLKILYQQLMQFLMDKQCMCLTQQDNKSLRDIVCTLTVLPMRMCLQRKIELIHLNKFDHLHRQSNHYLIELRQMKIFH